MGLRIENRPGFTVEEAKKAFLRFREACGETPSRSGYIVWSTGRADVPSCKVLIRLIAGEAASWSGVLEVMSLDAASVERQRRTKIGRYQRDDCAHAIRCCCRDLSHMPLSTEYERWRKSQSGEYPGYLTVIRFGDPDYPQSQRWARALKALVQAAPDNDHQPRKVRRGEMRTISELIQTVLDCSEDMNGDVPSSYAYDLWSEAVVSQGGNPPTSTTLRRRLGGDEIPGGRWDEVLRAAGLNPEEKSLLRREELAVRQRARCNEALQQFTEIFGGFAPLSIYLRWAMIDESLPSLCSVFYWLTPNNRTWDAVAEAAGFRDTPRVFPCREEVRKKFRRSIASASRCIDALRRYRHEHGGALPVFHSYRRWRKFRVHEIHESEILFRLAPNDWTWSTALMNANGRLRDEHGP
jgi:hypothetical protein